MGINQNIDFLYFLKALGFKEVPVGVKTPSVKNSNTNLESIEKINQEIKLCSKCSLSKSRKTVVCGEGDIHAKLMFIGEAPGVEEDMQGRPFVGEAGKLLTSLIEKMGFSRQQVYITNTVKCHPPNNRDPLEEEISACFEYLKREIAVVSPRVIMTLGKVATFALMGMKGKLKDLQISKIRGNMFFYNSIAVVPTFHPAYLLRNRKDKWLTWQDAQEVLRRLK